MKERISYFGAYWHVCNFTLEENTDRICEFLDSLRSFNIDFYSHWYLGANSKGEALKNKVDVTKSTVRDLLGKGVVTMPDGVILSYQVGFWNGAVKNEDSSSISFSLGITNKIVGPNNCLVRVGYSEKQQSFYRDKRNREGLVKLLKEHWNPDYIKIDGKVIWEK